ncbi:type III secretion system translocon protein SseD [Yersinia aleksiciae]|uniref:chemotaxis protein n=1 Tax=Yersinia aleksiciae TaxID=263819 RepID=UPI00119F7593|nr:chemotaxis protein [Yersinia aleksiciae]
MSISVSHEIKLLEQDTPSIDGKNDRNSNTNDVLSSLSYIISEMFELFKKMRDLLSAYNQKQQELGWNLQVSSMSKKRESIADSCDISKYSGAGSIISGIFSLGGGAASCRYGELASHIGSGLGGMTSGGSKITEGNLARDADVSRMISEMQSSNSQSYAKSSMDLLNISGESRQNSKELSKDITSIINQIAMAAKF